MSSKENKIKRRVRNAYVVSTVSMALVLFLLGAVSYLILNARKASRELSENVTLSVILNDAVKPSEVTRMTATLKKMTEVKDVEYVSKEAAAKDFEAYIGNDFVTFLDANPLPASLEVTINADYSEPENIKKIDDTITAWDNVEDVIYQEAIIKQISTNIARFNLLMALFGGTLLLISLILINNTIRMSIFSKRFVINTMKLVGATRSFILRPFLMKAFMQGIYASLAASIMMIGMIYGLNQGIPEAEFITDAAKLWEIFIAMIAIGITISLLFTYGAVLKYVRLNSSQIHIY